MDERNPKINIVERECKLIQMFENKGDLRRQIAFVYRNTVQEAWIMPAATKEACSKKRNTTKIRSRRSFGEILRILFAMPVRQLGF
jgi:hypothetical protein